MRKPDHRLTFSCCSMDISIGTDAMISDDDLDDLPPTPEAAFVRLVDILNERLTADDEGWRFRAQQYVQVLLAFIDEHDLEREMGLTLDRGLPSGEGAEFYDWFNTFRNTINYYQARYRFRHRNSYGDAITVALSSDFRRELHDLLNKIRKVVANLTVSDRKRDAIYKRIAALELEVDRSRTRLDAVMAFILEASETAGEVAENLQPVVNLAERVRDVFVRAKTDNEPLALPSPEGAKEAKRIAGPATPKARVAGSLDDEIPF